MFKLANDCVKQISQVSRIPLIPLSAKQTSVIQAQNEVSRTKLKVKHKKKKPTVVS